MYRTVHASLVEFTSSHKKLMKWHCFSLLIHAWLQMSCGGVSKVYVFGDATQVRWRRFIWLMFCCGKYLLFVLLLVSIQARFKLSQRLCYNTHTLCHSVWQHALRFNQFFPFMQSGRVDCSQTKVDVFAGTSTPGGAGVHHKKKKKITNVFHVFSNLILGDDECAFWQLSFFLVPLMH